jgi:hypothetical protein
MKFVILDIDLYKSRLDVMVQAIKTTGFIEVGGGSKWRFYANPGPPDDKRAGGF